jgi:putative ABC transport system permease protein
MYEKENMTLKIITNVSVLSLFISCIGLFGLVLFTVDRRKKEIGIRKAVGSSSGRILTMLNFQFIKWILAAFIISCPIIVYFMERWLRNFAFRINIDWWLFAAAGIITISMALISVSWHTWHIASRNPAECLRHE